MTGILVDSCIILDIVTEDPKWFEWSSSILEKQARQSQLFINSIIYAEISIGFQKIEELEVVLSSSTFKKIPLPWEASFLAGKAFLHYRKSGGHKALPLPDFFIGAHAIIEGWPLLTRDTKRFQYYYPKLKIISPSLPH
ncbi:MAG: type toxin-antitoxin system VapC family toxin [Gammaproteobacteria bacterium]|jgi:predicted nucleic acid-binding protein|nr:type toxin-antitoxin system VapC family toxin [Gammaproteobacteria bacterium]MCE3237157.1 type toxin-antitoxin system VapC family toxin [Gammaproteobacteria bacterium]